MSVKIYQSNSSKISLIHIFREMIKDVSSSRDLAWILTMRDLKGQYRQSFLGVLWVFITPLMSALVWIFLNASGAVTMADAGIPYAAYVFSGTMLWSIITESVNMPLKQTTAAKSIMNKINFPKEALLIAGLYKILGNTLIKVILIITVLLIFKVYPTANLLALPLVLLGIILFGFTIGLLATPLGMLYTDVGRALPMAMQFLMYLSPVVYIVADDGSWLSKIIGLNPTTIFIVNGRHAFIGSAFESLSYFGVISAVMLVLFFIGWFFYRFSIPIIVERGGI
jgi:lipopolysaccharide transport system permease protein